MRGLPHPIKAGTINHLLHSTPQPWTLPELANAVTRATPLSLAGYETRIAEGLLGEWMERGEVEQCGSRGGLPEYRSRRES